MQIFVTNLPSSEVRREHILRQLTEQDLDFEFVDCVIGNTLTDQQIAEACDLQSIREMNKDVEWLNKGMIGCSMTSQKIHKAIVDRDLKCGMLLEDDAALPPNFKRILQQCFEIIEPGDVILLFWMSWAPLRLKVSSEIKTELFSLYEPADATRLAGGSASIFSREAAAGILLGNSPIKRAPDCWNDFQKAGHIKRILCAYPQVVDTADFMSTMELGRFVSLRRLINTYEVFPFYQILRRKRHLRKKKAGEVILVP